MSDDTCACCGKTLTSDSSAEEAGDQTAQAEHPPQDSAIWLDELLDKVWCAALDALVMTRDEGHGEDAYLRKKAWHMGKARTAILDRLTRSKTAATPPPPTPTLRRLLAHWLRKVRR